MIRNHFVLALFTLAAVGASAAVEAQETPPETKQASPQPEAPADGKLRAWIDQLGAEDHDRRLEAEKALRAAGDSARAALEEAVAESDDPEVRWRARRVLRALDGTQPGLERRRGGDVDGDADTGAPSEPPLGSDPDRVVQELMQRLQREFGQDFGRLRGFDDLQRQMEEMRRRMSEMDRRMGEPGGLGIGGGSSRQMQLQVGPTGVRLEVTEPDDQGKPQAKIYEAESLEAFRAKFPEVAKRYLDGAGDGPTRIGMRPFLAPDRALGWGRIFPRGEEGFGDEPIEIVPPTEAQSPPPEGERLGIYVGDLAPAVREFFGIEPGQGLLVNSVEDGSLAAALGLEPRDIVLKIGGRAIVDTADVRAALRGIEKGQQVDVLVNRLGKPLELHAEKIHAAKPEARKLRTRTPAPEVEQAERRR